MNGYFAILPILSAALCIGLGLFIFSRNPRHPANIGFMLGMAALVVMEAGGALILLSYSGTETALHGVYLYFAGQAFLPASWLIFSIAFARADYRKILAQWVSVIIGAWILSLFFAAWVISSQGIVAPFTTVGTLPSQFVIGPAVRYLYIYLMLGMVLNLFHLEATFRSSSGSNRWQIKYVIFGIGAIFAFFIYLASQTLLFSTIDIQYIPLTSAVILISCSMIAIFVVRHRLLDVDIFVSRYIVYNSLTVLIVGLYLIAIGIATYGIRYLNIPFPRFFTTLFIFSAALIFVVLAFTSTLRRKIQLFINRHFYKHKYEFRDKWMETIEKVSSKKGVQEVSNTIIDMIKATMGASSANLWLYEPVLGRYYLYNPARKANYEALISNKDTRVDQNPIASPFPKGGDGGFAGEEISLEHRFLQEIRREMSPFLMKNAGGGEAIASQEAVLCAPLIADQDIVGFMLLGKDISGEPYRQDDFELLKAMTTQAAVQIKNIRLTQDVMHAKEVEAFHRLAAFIMHDIKNLANSLSLVSQNARHNMDNPEFQKDAIRTIDSTVARMKRLIDKLSTTPQRLEIKKVKTDMQGLLNSIVNSMASPQHKNVKIIREFDTIPALNVDPDAIEMVFLNLFMNAYDALGKDGEIKIQSSQRDGYIDVAISDNGAGMSKEFITRDLFRPFKTTKKSGLGIGLFQCKAIIEAHGGTIGVESKEGTGTTFKVRLPVAR